LLTLHAIKNKQLNLHTHEYTLHHCISVSDSALHQCFWAILLHLGIANSY